MKLRIGAFDYTLVYFDEELVEKDVDGDKYKLFGRIDFEKLTIDIWNGVHPQMTPQVIMHEIVHGILYHAGYQDHSEELINAITNGLLALSRDNPDALKIKFK